MFKSICLSVCTPDSTLVSMHREVPMAKQKTLAAYCRMVAQIGITFAFAFKTQLFFLLLQSLSQLSTGFGNDAIFAGPAPTVIRLLSATHTDR